MIELGYITEERDNGWFLPPNMLVWERGDQAITDIRTYYLREIYLQTEE